MRNGEYELVKAPPDYPGFKYRGRYVYEHRLVWWRRTGRVVPDGYVIHHKNENKRDNRFENLELETRADHSSHHSRERQPISIVRAACAWCGCTIEMKPHQSRQRMKASKTGRYFCSRSHGALYQHQKAKARA